MAFDPITSGQAVVTGPAKTFDPLASGQAVAHFDPVASGQAVPDTETSTAGAVTPPDEVRETAAPAPDPSLLDRFFGPRPASGAEDSVISRKLGTAFPGINKGQPITPDTSFLNLPTQWPGLPDGAIKQAVGNLGHPDWMPDYADPRELAKVVYDGLAPTANMLATPKNGAILMGMGMLKGIPLLASVFSAYFSGTMALQFRDQAGELGAILDDPKLTWQQKGSKIISTAATGLLSLGAAKGAVTELKAGFTPTPSSTQIVHNDQVENLNTPDYIRQQIPEVAAANAEKFAGEQPERVAQDLQATLRGNQIPAGTPPVTITGTGPESGIARLNLAGQEAGRQRARFEAQAQANQPVQPNVEIPPQVALSPEAQRVADAEGATAESKTRQALTQEQLLAQKAAREQAQAEAKAAQDAATAEQDRQIAINNAQLDAQAKTAKIAADARMAQIKQAEAMAKATAVSPSESPSPPVDKAAQIINETKKPLDIANAAIKIAYDAKKSGQVPDTSSLTTPVPPQPAQVMQPGEPTQLLSGINPEIFDKALKDFRDAPTVTLDRLNAMTPEQTVQNFQALKAGGGFTQLAIKAGRLISGNAEALAKLVDMQGEAGKASDAAKRAGDLPTALTLAYKSQFLRELHEAATGTGGIGQEVARRARAEVRAPMPAVVKNAELTLASQAKTGPGELPQLPKPAPVGLIHLSSEPDLTTVSPEHMGKAFANRQDLSGINKAFYYEEGSPMGQDEGLTNSQGHHAYRTEVPAAKLYDWAADPKGIVAKNMPNREATETAIKDAGYDGYRGTRYDGAKVVAMFKPLSVKKIQPPTGESANAIAQRIQSTGGGSELPRIPPREDIRPYGGPLREGPGNGANGGRGAEVSGPVQVSGPRPSQPNGAPGVVTDGAVFKAQAEGPEELLRDIKGNPETGSRAWGVAVENAGDFLRELSMKGDRFSRGYLKEQLDYVDAFLNKSSYRVDRLVSKEDGVVGKKIAVLYRELPTASKEQKLAASLAHDVATQDFGGAKLLVDRLRDWMARGVNQTRLQGAIAEPITGRPQLLSTGNPEDLDRRLKEIAAGKGIVFAASPQTQNQFTGEFDRVAKTDNAGATFNPDGSPADLTKTPVIVTLGSRNLKAAGANPVDALKYFNVHDDFLATPNAKPGLFRFGDTVSADLNVALPPERMALAKQFARDNNQNSIFDASTGKTIPTGGSGEALLKSPAELAAAARQLADGTYRNIAGVREEAKTGQSPANIAEPPAEPMFSGLDPEELRRILREGGGAAVTRAIAAAKLAERQRAQPAQEGPQLTVRPAAPAQIRPETAVPSTRDAISARIKQAIGEVRGIPKFTPFLQATDEWFGARQRSSLEARAIIQHIDSMVPDKVAQEAIIDHIQAGGDPQILAMWRDLSRDRARKAGYDRALRLTPQDTQIEAEGRKFYADKLALAQAWDVVGEGREHYVNQMWKPPFVGGGRGSGFGAKLTQQLDAANRRIYGSYFEGEQSGLKPGNKTISATMVAYGDALDKVIATKQYFKDLTTRTASDGRPLAALMGGGEVISDQGIPKADDPILIRPNTRPEGMKDYKVLSGPGSAALSGWKYVTSEGGHPVLMKGTLALHPEIFHHVQNILGRSPIRTWYDEPGSALAALGKAAVKVIDEFGQGTKRTMLGFLSPFHQVQEGTHAIGHRVDPFYGLPKLDPQSPDLQRAMNHGLVVAGDNEAMQYYMEGLGGNKNITWKIPVVGKWAQDYSTYLFHDYIPRLKFQTYLHIETRNMARYAADIREGRVSADDVQHLSAMQTNAAYGGLNYAEMGRNPLLQHALQSLLLAPDFLEARARFTGQAIKGAVGAKAGREQLAALATIAATFYVTARIGNKLLDDDYHWENHPFEIKYKNRWYSMRSVPEDIYKAFEDWRQFTYSRLSPIVARGSLELLTGRNYRGEKVTPTQQWAELATRPLPINVAALPGVRDLTATGHANPVHWWEQMMGTFGVHVKRASPTTDAFDLATAWKDKIGIPPDTGSYPASRYATLRYALEDQDYDQAKVAMEDLIAQERKLHPQYTTWFNQGRASALEKISKGFKQSLTQPWTGSKTNDRMFLQSLSSEDRAKVTAADQSRKVLYQRFLKMPRTTPTP